MSEHTSLPRSDRIALYVGALFALGALVLAGLALAVRLAEVSSDTVPVTMDLAEMRAALPLGPDGAAVDSSIDTATLEVGDPQGALEFALWAHPIWQFLVRAGLMVIAAAFFVTMARGLAFHRRASALAYAAAGVVAAHWIVDEILVDVIRQRTLDAVSDGTYEGFVFEFELLPFLVILLLGAFGTALSMGRRLQRETEGLV